MNRQEPSRSDMIQQEEDESENITIHSGNLQPPFLNPQHARRAQGIDALIEGFPNQQVKYEMRDRISVLTEDKDYAEFFKDVCLANMDIMELIVSDDQQYAQQMGHAKKTKREYRGRVNQLCARLKKRLHRHDSDSEDQFHGSQNGYKIQRR